jgi:ABC-type phosphate transport system permease subunit
MSSDTRTATRETTTTATTSSSGYAVFGALTGVATLAVLLQGLWAGIFLEHDGKRDDASGWIDVHARGSEVALLFAVLALVWAVWKLRERRDLWIGALVLAVLLVAESFIGGQIRDAGKDTLTAVHVPLGMAIMGVAVWLPLRARAGRRA